ncbi:MAG: mevalonate kinase [Chloroflexota bacterium]
MITATAPGKIILFGEHAVVYGRPAIAVPVSQLRAQATVQASPQPGVRLVAPDLNHAAWLADTPSDNPIAAAVWQVKQAIGLAAWPDMEITVTSQIPIASGLGSGAAITAVAVRAVTQFVGYEHLLTDEWVSALTYEVEKIHHGTPSGIDNTVVTYEQPVYFLRQQPQNRIETFAVAQPLTFLVADSGVRSSTKDVVDDVRRHWQANRTQFERIFNRCGELADAGRQAIEQGDARLLGRLMQENQAVLEEMTVSSPILERLVQGALDAGAIGAKLSGAGRGGNMIALVEEGMETAVSTALYDAGAKNVVSTTLK